MPFRATPAKLQVVRGRRFHVLLHVLGATSLLALIFLGFAFARSFAAADHSTFDSNMANHDGIYVWNVWFFGSARGSVGIGNIEAEFEEIENDRAARLMNDIHEEFLETAHVLWTANAPTMVAEPKTSLARRFGFAYTSGALGKEKATHFWLAVPYWLPMLVLLAPSLLWIRKVRRDVTSVLHARRRRAGLCPVCGYDIRATTDRCPECGTELLV